MKLTTSQKLFLHNVLFHYTSALDLQLHVRSNVEEIMDLLKDDLFNPNVVDDDTNSSEEEEEGVVTTYPKSIVENDDVGMITSLPDLRVKDDMNGRMYTLSFFVSNNHLCFDLLDDNTVVDTVYNVESLTRGGTSLKIHVKNDEDYWEFTVPKFSKEWTRDVKVGQTISF